MNGKRKAEFFVSTRRVPVRTTRLSLRVFPSYSLKKYGGMLCRAVPILSLGHLVCFFSFYISPITGRSWPWPWPRPRCGHARQYRSPPMGSKSTRRRRSEQRGTGRLRYRREEYPSSACSCSVGTPRIISINRAHEEEEKRREREKESERVSE